MKFISRITPVVLFFSLCTFARAQSGFDAYFGVGTMQADSNGQSIDTFGDGNLFSTPKLTGTFGKVGADFMITPHFGIGGETDFRFSQGPYAGLKYRPTFYDFNAIWKPVLHSERVVPEFQAGLGGVNLKFYEDQSFCDAFTGCSTSNTFLESSNHFQVHAAVGVSFYLTQHIFVRPQVDVHWVNNFFQFGTSWVPEYSASVGYSFGHH